MKPMVSLYKCKLDLYITLFFVTLKRTDNTVATQINRIVLHPTMPIVVSGHEDRGIKFYDLNTGKMEEKEERERGVHLLKNNRK